MEDGVKFIFKTLFKVPVIIFVSFFIFNILAFFLIYFKMLGFSYVIMQTAVENNYLPAQELQTLTRYAYDMEHSSVFQNHTYVVTWFEYGENESHDVWYGYDGYAKTDSTASAPTFKYVQGDASSASVTNGEASHKKQYGKTSRVGCRTDYTIVWPLQPRETNTDKVAGTDLSAGDVNPISDSELAAKQEAAHVTIPIRIVYEVPGLKYYPDLINY